MALQTEVWAADIVEKVFPDDSFMMESVDESLWVKNKTVHRPNSGAEPEVVVNATSFPMQVDVRDDEDGTYQIRSYSTKPIFLSDTDAVEVSYNKRASILKQHMDVLNKNLSNWMMYDWAPTTAATIIRTTGADRAALGTAYGATGTRKKAVIVDIIKLMGLFDDMDLPEDGRNLLLPAQMYADLVNDNWQYLVNLQATGETVIKDGQLLGLFGFKIRKRGSKNLLTYTNAGTPAPRTPSAATLTSANVAALAWHKSWVARAKGSVDVYINEADATYQGDVFSAKVRAGGDQYATDGTGVVALVEAT